jgi:hypothetical protein
LNNQFQQKVIDQAVGPRPQWYPPEYLGPWRRDWGPRRVEHFTQREGFTQSNADNLLRVILWLLIALFTIQLVDMIIKIVSS